MKNALIVKSRLFYRKLYPAGEKIQIISRFLLVIDLYTLHMPYVLCTYGWGLTDWARDIALYHLNQCLNLETLIFAFALVLSDVVVLMSVILHLQKSLSNFCKCWNHATKGTAVIV